MIMRLESATQGAGRPSKSSLWPPWIELMFMVDWRAPSGTTGMSEWRPAMAG
ncbi:hypothetical protein D3C85_1116820 [compost metagenome]